VSRYQKGKTDLDFSEARDSECQWHQLGHTQVCTSLQTDNHASTPPLSFLQAGCPSCRPTNSVKALNSANVISKHYTGWRRKQWNVYAPWCSPKERQYTRIRTYIARLCLALNVTLLAFAAERRRPQLCRLISPAHRALSSKPAGCLCCSRPMGQTDGQTDTRPLHTMWAASITRALSRITLGDRAFPVTAAPPRSRTTTPLHTTHHAG